MKRSLLRIILIRTVRGIIGCFERVLALLEGKDTNPRPLLYERLPEVEMSMRHCDILAEIANRADRVMEEKRLYLNPDLTLNRLAKEVWSNRTYVSKALRLKRGVSFREYVCHFRLKHAKKMCNNIGRGAYELAIGSGFNDVRTFNKAVSDFLPEMKSVFSDL
ncbi:MAG: helix-turn-helix domain-containing protein [Bacteroidales bacterium]|nr:helix-turn-helix domain-containing protein [Bacteroidales bacterium]